MKAYTDLPGVQFYAGNCITEETGKDNAAYGPRTGFCLETQYYPDTIHHANFPSAVFGPDRDYESVTVYRFYDIVVTVFFGLVMNLLGRCECRLRKLPYLFAFAPQIAAFFLPGTWYSYSIML